MKSLEEAAEQTGLTRRKIQECEKAGATRQPVHKTVHGYLRYDRQDIQQLLRARFYHGLGYSWPEIRTIFDSPADVRRSSVRDRLEELKKEQHELDCLVTIAEAIEKNRSLTMALEQAGSLAAEIPYDLLISAISAGIREAGVTRVQIQIRDLSDADWEGLGDILIDSQELVESGAAPESDAMQEQVEQLYQLLSGVLSPSIWIFSGASHILQPGEESAAFLDELLGAGYAEKLFQAIGCFCRRKRYGAVDRKIKRAMAGVEKRCRMGEPPESPPVQAWIQQLHEAFREIGFFYPPLQALQSMGKIFGSEAVTFFVSQHPESGGLSFLAEAIEHYCSKYQNDKMEELI